MLREIIINTKSYLRSTLTPTKYVLLLLLYKKEYKLVDHIAKTLFGITDTYYGEVFTTLQDEGWLKIVGNDLPQDIEVRQKFINTLDATEEELTKTEVSDWYEEYRELFKKTRKRGSTGSRASVIEKLSRFVISYPEYTKEQILKATESYIRTCAPSYKYLMQADYFISKKDDEGTVRSRLLTFLEEDIDENKSDFTTQI
jgi:hypothetical protein